MSDEKTAVQGNWDEDFPEKNTSGSDSQNGDKKNIYMSLSEEGNYRVRLVGHHVKFYRHWKPIKAITHYDYKDSDPAWKAGFYPSKRFAINVIDRADGQLKILEKGSQIFKVFSDYKSLFGKNPAGKDGPDFNIKVVIPGGKKRQTTYTVTHLDTAPFTTDEVAMIKENIFELSKIFKSASLESIQEQWDALPDEAKIVPEKEEDKEKAPVKEAQSTPAPAKEKMADAPANDDDLFGDAPIAETKAETGSEDAGELF